MSLVTIPASCTFLDSVARFWIEQIGLQAEKTTSSAQECGGLAGIILVPRRRAARHLMEAFLRVLDGRAALLPSIMAVGDVDDEALFSMQLDACLPPAVDKIQRLSVLAELILSAPIFRSGLGQPALGQGGGAEAGIERAWSLAQALADLMDEAERYDVNLAERLPCAVEEEEFAHHWEQTLTFLQIVTRAWPQWLEEVGVSNPVARQVALLEAQAKAWQDMPPQFPVWAVGFADGSSGIATILKSVMALPQGRVIFQAVDTILPEKLWERVPESHPQAQFRDLLTELQVSREDIQIWDQPVYPGREEFLRQVFVPEAGLASWGQKHHPDYGTIFSLFAEDPQQEAQAIALALRDVAEHKGKTAALVTQDRDLARRVKAELQRFGIYADDSAGEPLQRTPGAVFLRLVASAWNKNLSPVILLSLLKHPMTLLGFPAQECRALARSLEVRILRGPAPPPGIAGLRAALGQSDPDRKNSETERLNLFLDRIEQAFVPLKELGAASVPMPRMLEALVSTAEALTMPGMEEMADAGPERAGSALWRGEDGAMLSQHLADLMVYGGNIPPQGVNVLENFLTVSMAGKTLTGLRGHQDGVELAHPRISILGVLESRLLAFDTVILGGLNEGSWPPSTDPGPWLSRPMRRVVGLASPERQIGASAHDFVTVASSAKTVVLSKTQRCNNGPVVPARWLVRLQAFLQGQGVQGLAEHPALSWQKQLDLPEGAARPVAPPAPCPPVALRPRRLGITRVDVLKTDPYAIYARYILGLKALAPLEEGVEHADYGKVVHQAMEQMLRQYPRAWPANAPESLRMCFEQALKGGDAVIRPALQAWWMPRLERIAQWVAEQEADRMNGLAQWESHTEVEVSFTLPDLPGGAFKLTGRADRLDLCLMEGSIEGKPVRARIFDYKTGSPPAQKDVTEGWSPQIVLEGALLEQGAFHGIETATVEALLYWRLSGGDEIGRVMSVPGGRAETRPDILRELLTGVLPELRQLLAGYDQPDQPYRSQPWAGREIRYTDYAQLARVDEWRNNAFDER